MFGGHRSCGSGIIKDIIFHVTLQDQVIKALFDFKVWGLSSSVAIVTVVVEIVT